VQLGVLRPQTGYDFFFGRTLFVYLCAFERPMTIASLKEAAEMFLTSRESGWRNAKHRQQRRGEASLILPRLDAGTFEFELKRRKPRAL
jgi:hypothetical protein